MAEAKPLAAAARPIPARGNPRRVAAPRSRTSRASTARSGARRVVAHAADDLPFRLLLSTVLAIAVMFVALALDLTVSDSLFMPAAHAPASASTAPSPRGAPAVVGRPSSYVVRGGDTLRALATRIYDDESRWTDIYDANRDEVDDPENLLIGTRLRIPTP